MNHGLKSIIEWKLKHTHKKNSLIFFSTHQSTEPCKRKLLFVCPRFAASFRSYSNRNVIIVSRARKLLSFCNRFVFPAFTASFVLKIHDSKACATTLLCTSVNRQVRQFSSDVCFPKGVDILSPPERIGLLISVEGSLIKVSFFLSIYRQRAFVGDFGNLLSPYGHCVEACTHPTRSYVTREIDKKRYSRRRSRRNDISTFLAFRPSRLQNTVLTSIYRTTQAENFNLQKSKQMI